MKPLLSHLHVVVWRALLTICSDNPTRVCRFHVLLDRCYATTTPFPINTPHHDLFVGWVTRQQRWKVRRKEKGGLTCLFGEYSTRPWSLVTRGVGAGFLNSSEVKYNSVPSIGFSSLSSWRCDRDGQTVIALNGQQQEARFSFETFRFIETMDAIVSTYYLHCATRLCLNSFCSSVLQVRVHLQHQQHVSHVQTFARRKELLNFGQISTASKCSLTYFSLHSTWKGGNGMGHPKGNVGEWLGNDYSQIIQIQIHLIYIGHSSSKCCACMKRIR